MNTCDLTWPRALCAVGSLRERLKAQGIDELLMIMTFHDGVAWALSTTDTLPLKKIRLHTNESTQDERAFATTIASGDANLPLAFYGMCDELLQNTGLERAQTLYCHCVEGDFFFAGLQRAGAHTALRVHYKDFEKRCFEFLVQQRPQLFLLNPQYRNAFILNDLTRLASVIQYTKATLLQLIEGLLEELIEALTLMKAALLTQTPLLRR